MLFAQKLEAKKCLQQVSEELDSDVFIYREDMIFDEVDYFIEQVREMRICSVSRSNVALFLTTNGGNLHSAFKMARFLKRSYNKLILFICSYCKSAGTLLSIASDEIVMSDAGELGPLDVQVTKEGDVKFESSLNIQQSLKVIGEQAPKIFEQFIKGIYFSNLGLTDIASMKVLEDIAARISIGLLAPISNQIEPARLGELDREISVARDYGERLNRDRHKITESLIKSYPSHSFVIDYEETRELFGNCVRQPTEIESKLVKLISEAPYNSYRLIGCLEKLLEQIPVEDEPEIEGDSNNKNDSGGNGLGRSHTEEPDGLVVQGN
jgi:Serine dehydrogenase proteinase